MEAITINGKTWTKEQLVQLVMDSEYIAECIDMDLGTIEENEDIMAFYSYEEFSKKYYKK